MKYTLSKEQANKLMTAKLSHFFGVTPQEASYEQFYKAIAMIVRDMMSDGRREFEEKADQGSAKHVYYLCMEFLMGRSLKNNLYNLGLTDVFSKVLADYDIKMDSLYESEPDAGLGNGGLGRLAACYLDGLATQGYLATGYSILYEYGIFKQKIVDGWQTELPDFWLPGGALRARSKISGMAPITTPSIETTSRSWRFRMTCMSPARMAEASACCAYGRRKRPALI